MTYLYQNKKNSKKHIWKGKDTACKMWSTGGLNKNKNWIKSDYAPHKETCSMCITNLKKKRVRSVKPITDIEQYKLMRK